MNAAVQVLKDCFRQLKVMEQNLKAEPNADGEDVGSKCTRTFHIHVLSNQTTRRELAVPSNISAHESFILLISLR